MLSTLIMTIIGADRPGLVQLVADRVVANEGNWLESRMCRLGGQFAGIARVSVPEHKAQTLAKALTARSFVLAAQSDVGADLESDRYA